MRTRIILALALIGLGIGGWLWWRWYSAAHAQRAAIRGSGIIEVTQVDAAFEVPGRMVERFVDEGAMIDGGEPIARLDDREYRLQVERAVAAKAGRRGALSDDGRGRAGARDRSGAGGARIRRERAAPAATRV